MEAAVAALALTLAGCASNGTDTAVSGGVTSASTATPNSSAGAGEAGSAGGGRPASSTATTGAGANGSATTAYPASTAGGGGAPKTTRDPLKPIAIPDESACAPGPGPLPDGLYFGFMGGASADAFEFDLACWFSGEPAIAAATADGEESPPPNDYYIRNTNETLRREPVASGSISVAWIPDFGNPATSDITYTQWLSERDFGQTYVPPVWITVKSGAVVDIVEQWLP
ncbi:MAG: hypothetical protein OEY41_17575 [Acidimicrobiia bacterium]|nr:hypothetical protein [Acidimicrobiia bacterium]